MEVWKEIEGFEGLYQISTLGRVKSLKRKYVSKDRILKAKTDKDGYLIVNLSKNNIDNTLRIHKLVALHFIKNPNKFTVINHKDENKKNNSVENLEWCTVRYNNSYGKRIESVAEKNKVKVKCITTGVIFNSIKEAADFYKINRNHISSCCTGKRKSSGILNGEKLTWKHYEEVYK